MNIVFCIDSNLIHQACVMLTSLQLHNKNLNIHAILLNVKDSEKCLLKSKIIESNSLKIYDINDSDLKDLIITSRYISKATYLRFFIETKIDLSIDKVLYLDCDIIICSDISKLYNTDISNYSIAACYDLEVSDIRRYNRLEYNINENYFNAGILLINLDYWRKNNISAKSLEFLKKNFHKCKLFDQDALNYFLHGTVKYISSKYNVIYDFFNTNLDNLLISNEHKLHILPEIQKPVIIHYAGFYKPWFYEYYKYNYPFGNLWKEYLKLTKIPFKFKHIKIIKKLTLKNLIRLILIKLKIKKIEYSYYTNTFDIENYLIKELKCKNL